MPIPPQFIEPLSIELGKVFRNKDLEVIMLTVSGDGLYETWVGEGMPTRRTAFELLQRVNEAGIAERVLAEMLARRSHSEELRALVAQAAPGALTPPVKEEMGLSAQHAGVAMAGVPDDAFAPGLQKNVRPHLHKLDLMVWIDKLLKIRNMVCRVETSGRALGTGFLVGPEAVLTNWHVVDQANALGKLSEVECLFDYVRLPDGSRQPGNPVKLGNEPLAASGPFSPAEITANPNDPPPTPEQLDFALLRLAEPAGTQPVAGGVRGWLSLPKAAVPLDADAPLLIIQHPDGSPMKLAMDTQSVIGPNANGTRVRYRTNTDNGSSGSPVFSMDWDLLLLHHFGDPAWNAPTFNQGVPLDLIRGRIEALGKAQLLGA